MSVASEKDKEVFQLLKQGDDLALAELCDLYYETVYETLCRYFAYIHREDETIIADVVTDAFLKFSKDPWSYKPERSSLEYFLVMDAAGDLRNAWQKRKRQEKKQERLVELSTAFGNNGYNDPTALEHLIRQEDSSILERLLKELFPAAVDYGLAQLLLSGERRTEEYARLLNIQHLDMGVQRREVKRNKDRIDKVIERKLRKGGGHG